MISATLRLRLKPCCAVEQKLQSSAQPTCEETQIVLREPSGICTVSMCWPSASSSTHFTVPSRAGWATTMRGTDTSARAASSTRRALGTSVMASKSVTPCLWIHLRTLRP